MTALVEAFLRDGMVVVEDAIDAAFCDEVVDRRLSELGIDRSDPRTWRSGWHNLPGTQVYDLDDVAPAAADALDSLVGGRDALTFDGLPDNLIVNFPDPATPWWPPQQWDAPAAGWHKDGDWFRHFLDSPEQGLLGIVLWDDVTERQGPTYVAVDSLAPVARFLAAHPEGIDPGGFPIAEIISTCRDIRPVCGPKGTVVWAHPYLVHSASANATDRLRVISNTTAILGQPMRFGAGARTPVERAVLHALGVDHLDFAPTRERRRIVPERERRWEAERSAQSPG